MATSNRVIVPAARAALDQFKMEAATKSASTSSLKEGYNGDLMTAKQVSIGGRWSEDDQATRTA